MKNINNLDFNKALGNYTLLYGETNTKKTLFTANFVRFLLESKRIEKELVTILDFAPKFKFFNNLKIGGRIMDFYTESKNCNYIPLDREIIPPRLNAKSKRELYENLCNNYKISSESILKYAQNPTPFLIINDISIFLHLGSKNMLFETIKRSTTFFGNSYYGKSIKSKINSLVSILEKKRIEFFQQQTAR